MKARGQKRVHFVVAMLSAVLLAATPLTAYAYQVYKDSQGYRVWDVDPRYHSWNDGGYDQWGYNLAMCYSNMYIANVSREVQSGAIISQAGLTRGYGGVNTVDWGPVVINHSANPVKKAVVSSHSMELKPFGAGASAWGYGKVRDCYLNMHEVNSVDIFLLRLETTGPIVGLDNEDAFSSDFYVGSDGRTYGVPHADENGFVIMPDMARVDMGEGKTGYIDVKNMQRAALDYAETDEELEQATDELFELEADAFQAAFAEYYGVDGLSDEVAEQCVIRIRCENGQDAARTVMEEGTREALSGAIRNGSMPRERVMELTGQAEPLESRYNNFGEIPSYAVSLSDDAFEAVYALARPVMAFDVPVYAEDGVTVVGSYSIDRL